MSAPEQERRRSGDRRRGDRRANPPHAESSWFGHESFFDPGWAGADGEVDARLRAMWMRGVDDSALARIHRTYAAVRAAFGLALVAAQGAGSLLGAGAGAGTTLPLTLICIAYAVQAITLWLLPRFQPLTAPPSSPALRRRQWLATIGVDLIAFGALHLIDTGTLINYTALLVLPVLMAGVVSTRLVALGTAAGVALLLLAGAWRDGLGAGDIALPLLQAGLAGLGLFVIALLSGELAARLAREERAARGSLELARQQARLNRLVIEEMVDGVLVTDGRLHVRAANPAARALLVDVGLSPPAPFELDSRATWQPLADAVAHALADRDWPEAGRELVLVFASGHARTLRLRVRFVRGHAPGEAVGEPLCVLLLEDVRTAQARLRQEKLAAMGRVSAGIAHEIRNPLAAISQANALLIEDELAPGQQRLARIVADNVERLKRIVDDVMELAPGGPSATPWPLDASAAIAEATGEWARTVGLALGPASRLRATLPAAPLGVVFDREHLRRVLVNLLDNAGRHASGAPGAIAVTLDAAGDAAARLVVTSDGDPVAPDVEPYIFEPFYSTRSRGAGLGLYICRELCERYGASIEYRREPAADGVRNAFVVTMKRAALPAADASLQLSP